MLQQLQKNIYKIIITKKLFARDYEYEYFGITYKKYHRYFFWEIGGHWGDKQYYDQKFKFYWQWGIMVKLNF